MRFALLAFVFAIASLNVTASLWARGLTDVEQPAKQRAEKLDELFVALKQARTEQEADALTPQIWALWYQSGNDDVDLLMRGRPVW